MNHGSTTGPKIADASHALLDSVMVRTICAKITYAFVALSRNSFLVQQTASGTHKSFKLILGLVSQLATPKISRVRPEKLKIDGRNEKYGCGSPNPHGNVMIIRQKSNASDILLGRTLYLLKFEVRIVG